MLTKKLSARALLVLLAVAVSAFGLVGGTIAWFTDSVESSNNIITSGTLDAEMYWADGKEDPAAAAWTDASQGAIFNYDLWEPGYTEVRHIQIKNVGTLAFKYQLIIAANGEVSKLTDAIDVYYADPAQQAADRSALAGAAKIGTLTEVLADIDAASGKLDGGETLTVTLALKMQETAGNEYQGLSIGSDFAVKLYAVQASAEEDAFDNQYDLNPTWPIVGNGEELKAFIKEAGEYYMVEDAVVPNYLALTNGVESTLNLNGHTLDLASQGSNFSLVAQGGSTLILSGEGTVKMHKGFYANKEDAEIIVNGGTYDLGDATSKLNNRNNHSVIQNNSRITINGGSFISDVENAVQFMVSNNGIVEVNGGFFHNTNDLTPTYFAHGNNNSTSNLIYLKGGTFVNWNPLTSNQAGDRNAYFVDLNNYADNVTLNGSFILLVKGYEVISETQENGDVWYTVVPKTTTP